MIASLEHDIIEAISPILLSDPYFCKSEYKIAFEPEPEIGFMITNGVHSGGKLKVEVIGEKRLVIIFTSPEDFIISTDVTSATIMGRIEIIQLKPSDAPFRKELKIFILFLNAKIRIRNISIIGTKVPTFSNKF